MNRRGGTAAPLTRPTGRDSKRRHVHKMGRFPYGTEFVGNGVVPDVKFARTKRDVVMGRDATLETALELASGE